MKSTGCRTCAALRASNCHAPTPGSSDSKNVAASDSACSAPPGTARSACGLHPGPRTTLKRPSIAPARSPHQRHKRIRESSAVNEQNRVAGPVQQVLDVPVVNGSAIHVSHIWHGGIMRPVRRDCCRHISSDADMPARAADDRRSHEILRRFLLARVSPDGDQRIANDEVRVTCTDSSCSSCS